MATTPISSKSLPNRPSEEYLRKEAKRLARGGAIQLAAAQHRLARQYGYPNWADLINAVQAMASPSGGGSDADRSRAPGSPPARDSAITMFPLLPLRGLVAFPHVSYPIFLGRPKSINAVLHAKEHNIPILLAAQKDPRVEDVTSPEMYKVGTLATVVETVQLPDGTVKSIIEGNKRVSLDHISFDEDFAKAEAVEAEEPPVSDPRLMSLISSVLSAFVREHVRAVSAWEKDPESAGLSTAAIILREEQSALESIRQELLQRRDLARNDRFSEIIGNSPAMLEMFKLMEAAAASSISVLIEGENGTGKELVARAIYRTSDRAGGPFMALNCAAIPEGLMESELFGHHQGSFTGALEDKPGLFRAASGGVLFLDEIGDMPLAMQAKLLRAIEEHEVSAGGDTRPHKVDVRLLSATSRDLQAAITEGSFRRDLYYRLAALIIRVPPLRQRREDIPSLATLFLERAAARHRKRIQGLEPEALELLTEAGWPGNVRQLQNEMERAVAVARDDTISVRHLSPAPAASDLRLRQQLVTTPQLQQAIKILQLSLPELETIVRNELGGASMASGSLVSAKSASLVEAVAAFERRLIAEQPAFANLMRRYLKPKEASMLADRIASALRIELASKQALLETLNPAERLETLLAYLNVLS